MGLLQHGRWVDQWYDTKASDGRFIRKSPQFRDWITPDGSPGISGDGGFVAEHDRYHLYISLACPWAHRALIFRAIKGLEDMVSVSVVHWYMAEHGWTFAEGDGVVSDTVNGAEYLYEVYIKANPEYSGRVRFQYCGIRKPTPSYLTNHRKLSACLTLLLMGSAQVKVIIIHLPLDQILMPLTQEYMTRSTTGFIRLALPPLKKHTKRRLFPFFKRSTG